MIPPFGFQAHQAMRDDMEMATQGLWDTVAQLEQENAFNTLAHGLNHSKCSVC